MDRARNEAPCPCGSDARYGACCGRYHRGAANPATAGQLMRARYTAYVYGDKDYLLRTWHSSTRPAKLDLDEMAVKWLGLSIVRTAAGGAHDHEGVVEFIARYKPVGWAQRLHETSRFRREDDQWFYVDGLISE